MENYDTAALALLVDLTCRYPEIERGILEMSSLEGGAEECYGPGAVSDVPLGQ